METDIIEFLEPDRVIISLQDAKDYLRITPTNTREDSLIEDNLIPASIDLIEKYINRDITAKRRSWILSQPEGDYFNLPYAPIKTITQIEVELYDQQKKVLVPNQDYVFDEGSNPKICLRNDFYQSQKPTYRILYETEGIPDDKLRMIKTGILTLTSALYIERDGRSSRSLRNNYKDWLNRYKNYGYYGKR